MTSNLDPNRPRESARRRPQDYVRRNDGSWSVIPILLVVALVLGAGYMIYSANWNAGTNEPLNKRSEAPATGERTTGPTTTAPATSPPPKQQ